jgi:hypothetical protein
MCEGKTEGRSLSCELYQAEGQEQPRTGAGKARYRSGTGVLAVSGMDGWEAQAVGDRSCIYLAVQMHAQSFKASTDGLVKVPSFRPSQAPWTAPAGSSILLNLVRWNPAFTDCGLVNLGCALAQGSQRATERWACQGSASTGESDAVRMGRFQYAGRESTVFASGVLRGPPATGASNPALCLLAARLRLSHYLRLPGGAARVANCCAFIIPHSPLAAALAGDVRAGPGGADDDDNSDDDTHARLGAKACAAPLHTRRGNETPAPACHRLPCCCVRQRSPQPGGVGVGVDLAPCAAARSRWLSFPPPRHWPRRCACATSQPAAHRESSEGA